MGENAHVGLFLHAGTRPALELIDGSVRGKVGDRRSTTVAPNLMSHSRPIKQALLLAGILFSGLTCLGQTNLTPTIRTVDRDGRVVLSEKQADELGLTPTLADRQKLPAAIKERLLKFEASREAYLKEQELMKKRLLGATTEAERERIRAALRDQRDAWLRRARAMREEARERARELRARLPSMNEVIENARENAREAATQNRKRRGQD